MGRLSNTKNRQKQHASNLREGQSGRFQNNAERAKSEHISMVDLTAAEEEEPLDENILTNDKESDAEEYKEMNQLSRDGGNVLVEEGDIWTNPV